MADECCSKSHLWLLLFLAVGLAVAYNKCGQNSVVKKCNGYESKTLDQPVVESDGSISHKIVTVTDLDQASLIPGKKPSWKSTIKTGTLKISSDSASVFWDEKEGQVVSQFGMGGRAMELSDLAVFDGKLFTVDDRTGVIYRITDTNKVLPWVFINDGPGNTTKGLKGEWMTVKGCHLYVGGLGKEWTTTEGVFVNHHPMYVKKISPTGEVEHVNWVKEYIALRTAAGVVDPGYMIHESGQWSEVHQKWFFLPRRVSINEIYTEATDEFKGSNKLLIASEDFSTVEVKEVSDIGDGARGFSAFQFVPDTNDDLIVAIKSEERNGDPVGSYITVFNWQTGKILLPETKFGDNVKFEGIAFASKPY